MDRKRLTTLTLNSLSPEQRVIAERVVSGPRGKIGPPMNAWLHSPGVANPIEQLGEHVRFKSDIASNLSELIILVAARHFTAQYPWARHIPRALKAGLTMDAIAAIGAGRKPAGLTPDQETVYAFSYDLLNGHGVSDATFATMLTRYGEAGIIDYIGLIGYYAMLSMALVVDRYPPPPGQAPLIPPNPLPQI